ncbi:MAG: hypothetical protein FWD71_12865 [Oscillospiraceae bacterium]|nr:hypothetical protein [Oscillospiraceae bacterium]
MSKRVLYTRAGVKYIRADTLKKKPEFTKIFVAAIVIFCILCITANYIFAFLEKANVNADVTVELIRVILGTFFTYALKAGFENVFKIRKSKNNEESDNNNV